MNNIHKVIYINLDSRTDRRRDIENEFATFGISGERFSAIPHSTGLVGCGMSHLAVLERAKSEGWENVLIFEDDFIFIVSKEIFEQELQAFFNTHKTYDVLMLSYNIFKSEPCDETVCRAINVQTASGYVVHKRFYDALIQNLKEGLPQLVSTGRHWDFANDQYWKSLQPGSEWFCMNCRIGIQKPGFSNCADNFVEYKC